MKNNTDNFEVKKNHLIPFKIKFGWATGELATAFYIGVTMAFFMFYLTEALSISPAWAGTAILVPRLWDAITDPFMGAISDRTKTKIGRRRPYLLAGSILFGITFWLTLSPPDGLSEFQYVMYFSAMYILVGTAFTIFDIPYSSMTAEMTDDYKERTNLIGFKMMSARLGIVLAAFVSPIIYLSTDNLKDGFALLGLIGGVFIALTGLVAFFSTKKAKMIQPESTSMSFKEINPFLQTKDLVKNKPFVRLFSLFFLQNLAIGASASTLIYYIINIIKVDQSYIGTLFAIGAIVALLVTPIWVIIGQKIGKKEGFKRAILIVVFAMVFAFFLSSDYFYLIFVLYLAIGFSDAGTQLMPNSMVPDTVEYDEALTGKRREGIIFGAWAFCRKIGMAGGAFIASIILDVSGYVSGAASQPEAALWGIRIAYAGIPVLLWFVSWILLKKYDLSEEKFEEIKQQNRERKIAGFEDV